MTSELVKELREATGMFSRHKTLMQRGANRLEELEKERDKLAARVEELEKALPDALKLRTLAQWFDEELGAGCWGQSSREVQADLREWADAAETVLKPSKGKRE
jgi:hypothetical protein